MRSAWRFATIMLISAGLSWLATGCQSGGKVQPDGVAPEPTRKGHPADEHPKKEHPKGHHPNSEHPQ